MGFLVRPAAFCCARVVSGVLVALAAQAVVAQGAGAEGPRVGSVLAAAKQAIVKQSGVHLVAVAKSSDPSKTETVVGDLGANRGHETISEAKSSVKIIVTPTVAYLAGNYSGLTGIVGVSPAEARKIGVDWVSVKVGSAQYAGVASGVTIAALTAVLPNAEGTALSTEGTKGSKVYVLKWTTAATSSAPKLARTLTLSAAGPTLPVEQISTSSDGSSESATFSKWGEPVSVRPPPARATVPFSKIAG
jgi:hypothetical protein